MTRQQLSKALGIARSDRPLNLTDSDIFLGYALPDFSPVTCTIEALAALLRWECVCFDGSIDNDALDELARYGRQRFMVLDSEGGEA